jgi:2-methylcitrate dehydratase PrpD
MNSDDVWALLPRIEACRDAEIDARGEDGRWGTRITATFKDGRTEEVEVRYPRGGARYPLSNDEIVEKYERLAALVMTRAHADALRDLLLDLENCRDVTALSSLLSKDVKSPFGD